MIQGFFCRIRGVDGVPQNCEVAVRSPPLAGVCGVFPRSARTGGRGPARHPHRRELAGSSVGAPAGVTGPVGTDSKPKRDRRPRRTSRHVVRESGPCSGGAVGRCGSSRGVRCRRCPGRWGAPRAGVRTGGACAEVRQDPVDHRRLRDESDDPHDAVARGARERVDLEELLEERRPPAGGLRRRQSRRVHDRQRCTGRDGLLPGPHPARAVGIPAVVPRRDLALVRDVHQHPREELERVGGLGAGGGALRLVGCSRCG